MHTQMHTHKCTYTQMYTHKCTHTHTHTHIHTTQNKCTLHACMHTHARTHARTHAHTNTHEYTYTHIISIVTPLNIGQSIPKPVMSALSRCLLLWQHSGVISPWGGRRGEEGEGELVIRHAYRAPYSLSHGFWGGGEEHYLWQLVPPTGCHGNMCIPFFVDDTTVWWII